MNADDKKPEFDENQSEKTQTETSRPNSTPPPENADREELPISVDRWTLMRDLLVFQGKLILDGLRDLILSPLSIGAAFIGLIRGGEHPGRQFYDLLYLGRRTEKWINLFGATSNVAPPRFHTEESESVDILVERLEEIARRQYEKGGLTTGAKNAVDRALDALGRSIQKRK